VEAKLNAPPIVRPLLPRDLGAVLAIETAARPWTAQWTPESYLGASGGGLRAWVAEDDGRVVGFILTRTLLPKECRPPSPPAGAEGEVEILNLAVAEETRRRGVARALVETALRQGVASGAALAFLEVRASNAPACALYAALGFQVAGRRPHYYRGPDEDALVLKSHLPLPARC
jgi:ribosomal protein S18 acetylase RimI-like enzyme